MKLRRLGSTLLRKAMCFAHVPVYLRGTLSVLCSAKPASLAAPSWAVRDVNLRRPTSKHSRLLSLVSLSRHTPCFSPLPPPCICRRQRSAAKPREPGGRRLQFFSDKEKRNIFRYSLKLRRQDLNLRPPGYEPDELPDCSTPRQ